MPLSTGQLLHHDRYRIVNLLGQGGMGAVYRAWDTSLNIPVAIKENLDASPDAQRQFGHEAGMLARLSHPNLPRVTDYFFVPGQGQYLVMDFIQGEDLEARLVTANQARPNITGLPEAQVLPWIIQVCEALEYLHGQPSPIIHRDIKPANIKIRPDGRAILVDFGIAKIYDPGIATTLGARAVTPGYSPPEQYGGGRTDTRTDIYALGATLYHLLTGVQPPESVYRMTEGAPMPEACQVNPSISPATSQVIQRATQLAREQRFQSIGEFKRALSAPPPMVAFAPRPAVQAAPAVQTQVIPAQLPIPKKKIPTWLVAGGALLVLVVLAFFAYWLISGASPEAAPPPATQAPTLVAVAPTQAPVDTPAKPPETLFTEAPPPLPASEVPPALPASEVPPTLPPAEAPTAPPTALPAQNASGYSPVSKIVLPDGVGEVIRWVDVVPPFAYVLSREGGLYTYDLALLFKLEPPPDAYIQPVSQTKAENYRAGTFLYAGWLYAYGDSLQTFDLSIPSSPGIGINIASPPINNFSIQGNLLAVGTPYGFLLADMNDPFAPQWLTKINLDAYVYGIALLGDYLYTSEFVAEPYGGFRLRAFDISDPKAPKETFNELTKETAYHLKIYRDDQMVACLSDGVELWSLKNPASPVITASLPAFARVCALDGANVITAGEVFRIDGDKLVKLASFEQVGGNVDGFPYGSAITDSFVFLAFDQHILVLRKLY